MKKEELYKMAQTISRDVIDLNRDLINEYVHDAFIKDESDTRLSLTDAIAASTTLCLNLAPEISAAVTARMLVDLGLVTLEDG